MSAELVRPAHEPDVSSCCPVGQAIGEQPTGMIHIFWNVTAAPARMLSGFVPSAFERWFRDFGHAARPGDVDPLPVLELEVQRLMATASQYDMEMGPALEPPTWPAATVPPDRGHASSRRQG